MFDRILKFAGRKAVLTTAAVLALTSVAPTASFAGGRHWHGGGGAARLCQGVRPRGGMAARRGAILSPTAVLQHSL